MELIRPTAEIWEQGTTLEDMWKHIARCTRVCYQSTPKNDGETDEEFVKRVILRPDSSTGELNFDKIHGAMLEHGTVYLKTIVDYSLESYNEFEHKYENNNYSKVSYDGGVCYITTNLRVIYENDWLDDLQYLCSPTEHHAKRVTVSFTEESTRYCNYSLGKFGNHITCVKPSWLLASMPADREQYEQLALDNIIKQYGTEDEHNWEDIDYYLFSLMVSNYCYNNLILKGWKPQQAREVLPLATKSQLIHTAFIDDWKHFFALRADGVSGPPHPNAKLIAQPLKQEFIKRNLL